MNLAETTPMPRPDPVVFSRYRLKGELGRGGMGVVWRAEDMKLQRDVALKFLPELVVRDREAMADLALETKRCLELTHPHIVRVYDLVEENERAAISMELVDGPSLAERKLQQPDRCFTTEALASWVAQLCAALDYAHTKAHIVHRDLKPLNLLVNAQGDLKVVDFGIARSLEKSATRLSTDVRTVSVSLGYVGPQQLLGSPASVTDDIYSLGATLYELLTGKMPFFEGDIITQLREIVPPSMAARRAAFGIVAREPIPQEWEETVAACLAKKAEDRPATAGDVAARLGLALSHDSRPTVTTRTVRTAPRPDAKNSRRIRAALVLGSVAAIVAAAMFWVREPVHDQAGDATARPNSAPAKPLPPSAPAPAFVVTVDPPDVGARIWLGKESDKVVPDSGRLALAVPADGESLTVQAPGYQTYNTRVSVSEGKGIAAVKLVPVYGVVQVIARAGSTVTAIDARGRERAVGIVPASGNLRAETALTAGTYVFKLAHPDCLDAQQPGTAVSPGRAARVDPPQTTLPGELRVFSVPNGAEVFVNGIKKGETPATLSDLPSEKLLALEVYLSGHSRVKRSVKLKPGAVEPLDVGTLALESGTILLRLDTGDFKLPQAVVKIDGRVVPQRNGRLDGLEVGPRVVEILHPHFQPWKQTVTVKNQAAPVTVPVKLLPKPVELTLEVTGPAVFTVEANRQPVVVKNKRVTVPAGEPLTLQIAAAGFKTEQRSLTLPPGAKQTLTLAMEKVLGLELGKPWTVPDVGLVLLPLAAGTFAMGSEKGEAPERPVTKVTFKKPFWLGKTEVTQREWTAVMGSNPARTKGDDLPVESVSWLDAMEFCRILTERERAADRLPAGYAYTLPSEAQWEYACRAGETSDVPADVMEISWNEQNSGKLPHSVATRRANAWGFYDMHGNVWEWCADWYHNKLSGGSVDDPKGPAKGDTPGDTPPQRVRRGASYVVPGNLLRIPTRGKLDPEIGAYNLGFRLALSSELEREAAKGKGKSK